MRIRQLAVLLIVLLSLVGCRRQEPTRVPAMPGRPAATLAVLATAVPAASATPEVPNATAKRVEVLLPADPNTVVVQVARIAHSPWEPAILAQMSPVFSLQASGFAVFPYPQGPSEDGWYQSALSDLDALRFVRLLVNEVGVLELAAGRTEPTISFRTALDGTPAATDSVTVVYVRSAESEGRLVLTDDKLARPSGDDAERVAKLKGVLDALDAWRSGAARELSAEEEAALSARLGWSSTVRKPYTPDRAVAFGTRARVAVPPTAPAAEWPLQVPLAQSLSVPFGAPPREILLQGPDVVPVLRAARKRPNSIWGPLWRDAGRDQRYLVGVRAAPPGSNHVVIDYDYQIPPPRMGLE